MQLGISSFTYPAAIAAARDDRAPWSPLRLIELAAVMGTGVVQFGDNLPLHELDPSDLAALRDAARRHRIALEVGMRGFSRDLLETYLHIARYLASPILRVVTDTRGHEPSVAEMVQLLRAVEPALGEAGVAIAIENHDRLTSAQLDALVRDVGSPRVGICLDTVNSLVALEDPYTVTRTLAAHTLNLHIKDVRARRDPTGLGVAIQGAPAGHGQVDIPWVLAQVQAHGRCRSAILEQWTPPAATSAETIERESQWAQQGVAYLRTFIPH